MPSSARGGVNQATMGETAVKLESGLTLLEDIPGTGAVAQKGDRVTYNVRLFLNRGEEVPLDERQRHDVSDERVRIEGGREVIDRVVTLGKRDVVPAVEHTLNGMRVGGYRKVKASPHLAYRQRGIPGLIPENAVLIVELWLRAVHSVG